MNANPTPRPLWVVKLGGSLNDDPVLPAWLALLATRTTARIVVVPGGGTFADEVRRQQPLLGFDDRAAHEMAILAMAQTATALASLAPAFRLADDHRHVAGLLDAGGSLIWRPLDIALQAHGIVPGWDITADSLALWLATQLGAHGLLLVKSCPIDRSMDWDAMADHEVVDRRFPSLVAAFPARIELVHRSELAHAEQLLDGRSDA